MLATLLESRSSRARRPGATFVSVLSHATILTAAVIATARANVRIERPKPETTIFTQTPHREHPPAPSHPSPPSTSPTSAPALAPALIAPIDIPSVIPHIDLGRDVTDVSDVIGHSPLGVPGGDRLSGGGAPPESGIYSNVMVDLPAVAIPGQRPPEYPAVLRQARMQGAVDVQFVVDTTGRADMSTFKVLSSPHELFTNAVRNALPKMRFQPAEVNHRKVRVVVQQAFTFVLGG
jgi:protein TonB